MRKKAKKQTRVQWLDADTGSNFIADLVDGKWQFSEKEYAGTRWYDVPPTPDLVAKAQEGFTA